MAKNRVTTQVVARWAYVSLASAREFAEVHGHPMDIAVIMRTITDRNLLRAQFEENWEYPKAAKFHFVAPGDVLPVDLRIGKVATMGKFNPGASWMLCLIARCIRGAGIRTWTDLTKWEPTEKETKDMLTARMEESIADLPDDGAYEGETTVDQIRADEAAEDDPERLTHPPIASEREPVPVELDDADVKPVTADDGVESAGTQAAADEE